MTLLLLMGLFGCGGGSREENAEKRILEAMQEKYGKEFVLDSIGGSWGTMNNNTLKAVVRPADDNTLKVPVEITKDLKDVYDMYLNQAVARNEQPKIEAIAKQFWPDSKIVISNDTKLMYPEDNNTSMSYKEFLEKNPNNTMLIMLYLNGDQYVGDKGTIDEEKELKNQLAFANQIAEQGYVSTRVSFVYAKPEMYNRFEEALQSSETVDRFFEKEQEKTGESFDLTRTTFKVDKDGKIVETEEKIKSYFELWKEEREEYASQRGGAR
ncbi:hypothetical protein ACE6ED_23510 [Paenibacillus sp. CN-4]|uniref:hypothetical protein n=1 Tax=Paenibacillus nanchangensis TaxID=3348343 RepID=UPI00397B847E